MGKLIGKNIVSGSVGVALYIGAFLALDLNFSIRNLIGWIMLACAIGHALYAETVLTSEAWLKGKED